jgi:hypothetical protein
MHLGESSEESPAMFYMIRVQLWNVLEKTQERYPTDLATPKNIDDEGLEYITDFANSQIEMFRYWKSHLLLPHLRWEDEELPSTDPLMASLRAEYYRSITRLLQPYLKMLRSCECLTGTVAKSSAQQGFIGVVNRWVQAALSNIVAFDRIGEVANSPYEAYRITSKSLVMLSNPVETLHSQVTLSFGCYFLH